jgi:hypothetical protein
VLQKEEIEGRVGGAESNIKPPRSTTQPPTQCAIETGKLTGTAWPSPNYLSRQRGSQTRYVGKTFWGFVNGQVCCAVTSVDKAGSKSKHQECLNESFFIEDDEVIDWSKTWSSKYVDDQVMRPSGGLLSNVSDY